MSAVLAREKGTVNLGFRVFFLPRLSLC